MAVKILVVSRFPPDRDGIASYAMQLVMSLRREGHLVEVVSPYPSAATYSTDFQSNWGLLRVMFLSWRADRTIVEFVAAHFFRSLGGHYLTLHWPAFVLLLALGRNVDLVVHEAPYHDLDQEAALKGWLVRAMWRRMVRAPRVTYVHTEWERAQLASAIRLSPRHIELLAHGRDFMRRTHVDRAQARLELGLPLDEHIFLCIGFLQSHKGFDRAVLALRRLNSQHVRLEIVGSMRLPAPEIESYVHQLRMLVAATPGAHLREGYVTDELFDRWIVAADTVVLPYRDISSSGVVERAKLYGRTLVVANVGGLPEQAGMFARVATSDEDLVNAMASAAGVPVAPPAAATQSSSYVLPIHEEVRKSAVELRARRGFTAGQLDAAGDTVGSMPLALRLPFVAGSGPRTLVKRMVAALTRWELRPIVNRVNDLQYRTDARLVVLERKIDELNRALAGLSAANPEPAAASSDRASEADPLIGSGPPHSSSADLNFPLAVTGEIGSPSAE